jgi:hypothetical protein
MNVRQPVKQPTGTNHFQFRFHQESDNCGAIGGGVWSIRFFYPTLQIFAIDLPLAICA